MKRFANIHKTSNSQAVNLKKGKIIILSGPSGSGKTTLYKRLLASRDFKKCLAKSISVTTRPMRPGEKHGRDYFFVSPKMFLAKKEAGHFLESQKVFDNYYGTPNKQVRDLLKKGKNVLLCIDVKGARIVCQKYPDAVRIFVKTPSLKILKRRLEARRSEHKDNVALRLKRVREELNEAKDYDYTIINDDLSHADKKLKAIISTFF